MNGYFKSYPSGLVKLLLQPNLTSTQVDAILTPKTLLPSEFSFAKNPTKNEATFLTTKLFPIWMKSNIIELYENT